MELRHLRYFVAVAEERSFTRAAERLWIAQPGLSQQIRGLERELGVMLFERLSRGVELTDAGELFLPKAHRAIAAADEALATGRAAGAGLAGHLRIGISTHARWDLAPLLLESFRAQRPGVELSVVEAQCGTLVRDVRDSRLDVAVILGPVTLPLVESAPLWDGPVAVALSRRHAMADKERITAADLDGHVVAVSGDRGGVSYDRLVDGLLTSFGVRFDLLHAGYGPAMLAPVRSGAAVALTTGGVDGRGDVVLRPLEPAATFRFDVAWRSGDVPPALEGFLETARSTAATAGHSRRPVGLALAAERPAAAVGVAKAAA
jgi:DNA-binding transcriptional LysR family regulator